MEYDAKRKRRLWYRQPANVWEEAMPIGNGHLGAMVYGGWQTERLQLNEDSLYYGAPQDRISPDALPNLEKVRRLVLDGDVSEAERLLSLAFSSMPRSGRPYQPAGDCYLDFSGPSNDRAVDTVDYSRNLYLAAALHTSTWHRDGCAYRSAVFASYPDDVVVIHLESERQGGLSFSLRLARDGFADRYWTEVGHTVALGGYLGQGGLGFCLMASVRAEGGTTQALGGNLVVQDADRAIVCLTAASTWRHPDAEKACRGILARAMARPYAELLSRHTEDYAALFGRVSLVLPEDSDMPRLPTDERIRKMAKDGDDEGLLALYFDYARYLLISCSRAGPKALPANLQGLWNPDMQPPWDSRYTININTEMNYWMAESASLPECHWPLFELTRRLIENGRQVARRMYGCRGSAAHHNADLFCDAAPYDAWIPGSFWVLGAAWLCIHLWTHYEYTCDISFLEEYYPLMREAALFFEDFMIEKDGYLVVCPTVSPENSYILPDGKTASVCAGAAMDNSILRDLFTACIEASALVGRPEEDRAPLRELLDRLAPDQIGRHGQLMEWLEDYDEAEPGHRHISHLFALHPAFQITPDETPDLAAACEVTLRKRLLNGGGLTGWSRAWIICQFARLWKGENAREHLVHLLADSTLPNMLDTHPPFQIDGNFGGGAGIVEMLVQCSPRRTVLLPALPARWHRGSVRGLKLRGGVTLDMDWREGELRSAVLTASCSVKIHVVYKKLSWEVALGAEETVDLCDFPG